MSDAEYIFPSTLSPMENMINIGQLLGAALYLIVLTLFLFRWDVSILNKENCFVYCHISPSGKLYVGITSQLPQNRWRNGKGYKKSYIFNSAIEKYGWDAFEHVILFENVTRDFAIAKEIELISEWKTTDKKYGYNQDMGGTIHSEETKRKIGAAHSGENNYWHNHKHTEEYCKNMSEKLRGREFTDEHRKNLSKSELGAKNHRYGKTATAEVRLLKSESYMGELNPNYGNKWTDEQKQAQSKRFNGIYRGKYTEEMRKRMTGETNPSAKKVVCNGEVFGTVSECAKSIGVSVTTISPYLAGSRKMPDKYKQMGLAYV